MLKIGDIEIKNYPILLAPMEDVTDPPFRHICKKYGADIMYTEFISSDGLIRDASKSMQKLDFEEFERPIGIQIFGNNIDSMVKATEYAEAAKPDIIDINFGCPVKKVASKGAGSGAMNDIPKMVKMTEAVVKATSLPVTVKTRLGYDDNRKEIADIAERLQDVGIQAITIHGRTRTMRPRHPADWTLIGKVKENPRMHIPVIGNGDIFTPESALHFKNTYGVDGLMIGRKAMGYPWIFREIKHYFDTGELLPPPTIEERVDDCLLHLHKSIEWKGEKRAIFEMRKFYGDYFSGLPGIKQFKVKLVSLISLSEIEETLQEILEFYQ
ncbi:MAG: tRNA dihydrouridine synthase DusB [Bacteroidales bacterium]|mgnify:CR=1 FL=1|nr:tRNA dihydrouridine synthase DusB [Bacteroidales bacterium]MCF8399680.1 tRNA dihydrouridine synthase DusB [Bacteroidales bacterium]